jgi:phosphoenolpyruvate carboxylase
VVAPGDAEYPQSLRGSRGLGTQTRVRRAGLVRRGKHWRRSTTASGRPWWICCFRTLVDNLEMTLAKSSLPIAHDYLRLVDDATPFAAIEAEHQRTVEAVLRAAGVSVLLERSPVLQRSVALRNPYVDPMNAIQVELLRRYRAGDESVRLPLMRSIAGISAALRNTG